MPKNPKHPKNPHCVLFSQNFEDWPRGQWESGKRQKGVFQAGWPLASFPRPIARRSMYLYRSFRPVLSRITAMELWSGMLSRLRDTLLARPRAARLELLQV